jgi:hypothetical protein
MSDWRKLVDDQAISRLSIKAFCQQQNITSSNFYKYRKRLNHASMPPSLVKVTTNKLFEPALPPTKPPMTLHFGTVSLTLSSSCCEPQWLANFIKALQA